MTESVIIISYTQPEEKERWFYIWKFKTAMLVFTHSFLDFRGIQIVKMCERFPYIWKQWSKMVGTQDWESSAEMTTLAASAAITVALISPEICPLRSFHL